MHGGGAGDMGVGMTYRGGAGDCIRRSRCRS